MSGRTTPECYSLFEVHDNDSQSERSVNSQDNMLQSDGIEINSDSSMESSRRESEFGGSSSADELDGLEVSLFPGYAQQGVDLLEAGTWAPQNPGTDLPRHTGVIPQELSLEDEPIDIPVPRRPRGEGPWSILDPIMVAYNRISIQWITRMNQPQLIRHTKVAVQEFFNFDMAGCARDIEGTWIGARDVHRHVRLAYDALIAMVVALAVFAFFTLGSCGIELSFMIVYGLVLLAIGVLIVIRLLLI